MIVLAVSSARRCERCGASASKTLRTPSSFAAASATLRQFSPATRISTSLPKARAAVRALAVAGPILLLSCSARRRTAILENSRLVLQLVDEHGNAIDLHAGLAALRLDDRQDFQARRDIDAKRLGRGFVDRLLLRFHDVGKGGITRLVEP